MVAADEQRTVRNMINKTNLNNSKRNEPGNCETLQHGTSEDLLARLRRRPVVALDSSRTIMCKSDPR